MRLPASSTGFASTQLPASSVQRTMSSSTHCRRTITEKFSRPNYVQWMRSGCREMVDRLRGKVAIVVGAGSIGPGWGNGKAIAVTFAREGAKVLCVDIDPAAAEETVGIIRGEGGKARLFQADVTKSANVAAMTEECMKAYGRIDVLDNNVGIAAVGGVVEVSEEEWDRVMAINLKSCLFRHEARHSGHGKAGRWLHRQYLFHRRHPLHGRSPCHLLCEQGRHEPPNPHHRGSICAKKNPRERHPARPDGDADGAEISRARGRLWRRRGALEGARPAGSHGPRGQCLGCGLWRALSCKR